jgi:hypothetical protein
MNRAPVAGRPAVASPYTLSESWRPLRIGIQALRGRWRLASGQERTAVVPRGRAGATVSLSVLGRMLLRRRAA